eukprot:SAG22_NODE_5224_length_1058_cov_1.098019_2_plen_173_part_01
MYCVLLSLSLALSLRDTTQAEAACRADVHTHLAELYAKLEKKLCPKNRDPQPETEGAEPLECDETGFLVSEGGFKAFKRGAAGAAGPFGDPLDVAEKVLDAETMEQIEGPLAAVLPTLEQYKAQAEAARAAFEQGGREKVAELLATAQAKAAAAATDAQAPAQASVPAAPAVP